MSISEALRGSERHLTPTATLSWSYRYKSRNNAQISVGMFAGSTRVAPLFVLLIVRNGYGDMRILLTSMAPIFSFVHHGALHLHHPVMLVKGLTESKGYETGGKSRPVRYWTLRPRLVVSGWSREQRAEPAYVNAQ